MSATTKLQFTLTSPGSNPTPTPSDPGTTTTPIYTTVVGSPNTGENSSAGDNFSGTVFTTLFIIIGFAALVVFLVNYLLIQVHFQYIYICCLNRGLFDEFWQRQYQHLHIYIPIPPLTEQIFLYPIL